MAWLFAWHCQLFSISVDVILALVSRKRNTQDRIKNSTMGTSATENAQTAGTHALPSREAPEKNKPDVRHKHMQTCARTRSQTIYFNCKTEAIDVLPSLPEFMGLDEATKSVRQRRVFIFCVHLCVFAAQNWKRP